MGIVLQRLHQFWKGGAGAHHMSAGWIFSDAKANSAYFLIQRRIFRSRFDFNKSGG